METKDQIVVCKHENVESHRAEPDVGISNPYWLCLDCDQTTDEWEDTSDEDGRGFAPVFPDIIHVMVPDGWYIIIDRLFPEEYEHVVIGPFSDQSTAESHMQDSMQVQSIVEDDCSDCGAGNPEDVVEAIIYWMSNEHPWEQYDIVEDVA